MQQVFLAAVSAGLEKPNCNVISQHGVATCQTEGIGYGRLAQTVELPLNHRLRQGLAPALVLRIHIDAFSDEV
eukprot:CAMPEP_0180832274 /NCGR_PEP_ID=MMETSP1038_2-20121128/76753_1 /TAXON_ID=632150 /ORGANISM="Azadinium spinosum, Strain 3D9" /LENGTH=72 /DNA_ID=CAMNT_0022875465 /DNA_START=385 /DNA_END=603 /DNA_ORIENTATION=-